MQAARFDSKRVVGECWSVETVGRIRREHFVKGKTIREIARDLGCPGTRSARYCGRGRHRSSTSVTSSLGRSWGDGRLNSMNCWKAMRPSLLREQLTLIRIFEELRGRGYDGGYDARAPLCQAMGQGARAIDGGGLRPAELRARGSLPVRLEPRGRPAERRDGDREGRPCPALSQPHAVRARLSARDAGDGVRRPRPGLRPVQGRLAGAASTTT